MKAVYNYSTNGGFSLRHYVGKSTYKLPKANVPEGSELYQYDTDKLLFFDSERGAWYDNESRIWYKPGTVMEPLI